MPIGALPPNPVGVPTALAAPSPDRGGGGWSRSIGSPAPAPSRGPFNGESIPVEAEAIVAALSFRECVLWDMEVGDSGVPCGSRRSVPPPPALSGTSTSRWAECKRDASEPPLIGVGVVLWGAVLRRPMGESMLTAVVPLPAALGGEGGGDAGASAALSVGRVLLVGWGVGDSSNAAVTEEELLAVGMGEPSFIPLVVSRDLECGGEPEPVLEAAIAGEGTLVASISCGGAARILEGSLTDGWLDCDAVDIVDEFGWATRRQKE